MKNLLSLGLGLFTALSISAVPLNPGDSVPLPGTLQPVLGDFLDTEIALFSEGAFPNNLTGTVFSTVVANDFFNPHAGLTFVYEILNVSFLASIGEFSVPGFDQIQVDASFFPPGNPPAFVNRSSNGSTITFDFDSKPLGMGLSGFLVLRTSALDYTETSSTIGNGVQATVNILAPVPPASPVPDGGSTVLLLGLALVGLGAASHRAIRA